MVPSIFFAKRLRREVQTGVLAPAASGGGTDVFPPPLL